MSKTNWSELHKLLADEKVLDPPAGAFTIAEFATEFGLSPKVAASRLEKLVLNKKLIKEKIRNRCYYTESKKKT